MNLVHIKTDNQKVNDAYYFAVSDLVANIKPFKSGLLNTDRPVIIAGSDYTTPWTRDAAINVMNAGGYLAPEVSKNTLQAVLKKENDRIFIDGQYWDAIIWVLGAWSFYLYTGDREFLAEAYEATRNSLEYFENTEFDPEKNLFRGPACYGDGVAAYPAIYARHGESGIASFAEECRDLCVDQGVGIPMFALSTNCLYYAAYVVADLMGKELGMPAAYTAKAQAMKHAVNEQFWMEDKGRYRYLIDPFGGCDDFMEGMGHAFVVLFGIADEERAKKVFENQHITQAGIPCVWPTFERYITPGGNSYGRHSGTVWPHIQAFWGDAAIKYDRGDLFSYEFYRMTEAALRDGFFAELYHPDTGEMYGGIQEEYKQGMTEFHCCIKQTWSATGYLHMIFMDILGMEYRADGVHFSPYLPDGITEMEVLDLCIRGRRLNISLSGEGRRIDRFLINGKEQGFFAAYNE